MTIIKLKKKYFHVPTEWNELTADQLVQVMDAIENKTYRPEQLIFKLFKILLSISYRRFFKLKTADLEEYLYLVAFFLQNKIGLTKQLIPRYQNLYGPADEISNIIFGEFVFTEHYYMQWQENKTDLSLLDHLVASLYRPAKNKYDFDKNPDGDCRLEYNENVAAYYANNIVKRWPLNIKLSIAHWYSGCRQKIVDDNPDVFGGNGEPAKYGLISIIRSIAQTGTHGDFGQVEKKLLSLIMIELNETVEDGRRQKNQIPT